MADPFDPIPRLKQQVGAELAALLKDWPTTDAIEWLGIGQPRISDLRRQKLDRFSLESLIRYADRLMLDVKLSIELRPWRFPPRKKSGGDEGP